ncbi:MAG: hypothetical protein LKE54_04260 [Prevotella sp.]|jgi:hypothetical protein|nr:hypothetical protein [Prevotella sp.]MCH3994256.1 hypothetical protein [Prevotella sp.]
MKNLLFSLTAAIVMSLLFSACSSDDANGLLDDTARSGNTSGITTVSLDITSGIEIKEDSSSFSTNSTNKLTRAITTSSANFTPVIPTQFTAYFVAAEGTSEYAKGSIVRKVTVNQGSNRISVPAIKYHIYVTNYEPTNSLEADRTTDSESAVEALEDNLPVSSTTLYLFGTDSTADFSSTTAAANATVNMVNHYAAVCVANNGHVKGVVNDNDQTDYALDDNKGWYYIYVKAPTDGTATTNFTVIVENLEGIPDGKAYDFPKSITADNIYQYTVNASGGIIITVDAFQGSTPTTVHYHVDWNSDKLIKDS